MKTDAAKTRASKKGWLKVAILSASLPLSPLAMAHNEETASSVLASLAHQLASPDHLLALAGGLVLAAAVVIYGPALYRRIRQDKR